MSTDPKIYTAAEVASVGISKEEIDQAVAKVTKEAYKAAKHGEDRVIHYSYNLNVLYEIDSRLKELGYTTELFARALGNPYIIVRWSTD